MRKFISLFFLMVVFIPASFVLAQNHLIDVKHYRFALSLNDSNNIIDGQAAINFTLKQSSNSVYFDLAGTNDSTGKGMKVVRVLEGRKDLQFSQEGNRLNIFFGENVAANSQKEVEVFYEGVPADGLIIDTNKYGNRTFFGDNWPDRAHNWLPCNDYPDDKASVEFIVTAPDHYKVIANGILVEESSRQQHTKLTHWLEEKLLPTKVMVIGVAAFDVQLVDDIDCIPITSWVFPENRDSGFAQYAIAKKIFPFFLNYIGPYPYKKLANVQSRTRFGGMENASNIFYYENSVLTENMKPARNRKSNEALFAHEIAHQWFGNDASEIDWQDVWLSESFATYMTHLYMESRYSTDELKKEMQLDREAVIDFNKTTRTPIVDNSHGSDLMELLNINTYQKGSWVLHMLRHQVGDSVFQKGIRLYYNTYKGKNASTKSVIDIMENVSHQDLNTFFNQWLFTAGHPIVKGNWRYDEHEKLLIVSISQEQNDLFQFPLEIGITDGKETIFRTIDVSKRNTVVKLPVSLSPNSIVVDPKTHLLFEGNIIEAK